MGAFKDLSMLERLVRRMQRRAEEAEREEGHATSPGGAVTPPS